MDTMSYSKWFDDREMFSLANGGENLWYMEFVFNGAKCSDTAMKQKGTCIDETSDMDELVGSVIIAGTRTYALKSSGVGPSKDELFEARMFLFESKR